MTEKREKRYVSDDAQLMLEWDWTHNAQIGLDPCHLSFGSNKYAHWICINKHHYSMKINHRTHGHKCPYCSGRKVFPGYNDFETWCKSNGRDFLLTEWKTSKSGATPSTISRSSKEIVTWRCRICGNEWDASVHTRSTNFLCPHCANRTKTSFPEQAILFYILKLHPDAISRYSNPQKNISEIDIFLPSIKLGIEYDGRAWHNKKQSYIKEKEKYQNCKKEGLTIIRVRETGLPLFDDTYDYYVPSIYQNRNHSQLNSCIAQILSIIQPNHSISIDTNRDKLAIFKQYYSNLLTDSLAELYPNIASEWHPYLNGPISPHMIPAFSNDSFFFLCDKGHTYEKVIAKRTMRSDGCPFCSGRKVLKGFNDLATTHPNLILEWDYNKNHNLSPSSISKGYDKKVWWKCENGHHFFVSPNVRTSQGVGCAVCHGGIAKNVNAYTLAGKFIKRYPSLSAAATAYGVTRGAILRACKHCTPCMNIQFRYASPDDSDNIAPYKQKTINNKPVRQYDLYGNYLNTYVSATAAKAATGATKIGEVCHRNRKSSGGYIWRFSDDCSDMPDN